jgi:methionine-rich copper-binding protein CopC
MTPTPEVQERLRQYLLGLLADNHREELEKELMASDELFEELLVAEDEIVDDYLAERLSESERSAFEKYFLATPERQDKLKFGRALARFVTGEPAKTSSGFLPGFMARQSFLVRTISIAAVIAALAGTVWLFLLQKPSPQTFATLNLTLSQGTRAEGPQVPAMKLPISEDALKLTLKLPDDAPRARRFRAELETRLGDKRTLQTAAEDNQSVSVIIPASELNRGEYSIKLFAVSEDGHEQRIAGNYLFTLW